jgi:hypothetical protein
MVYGIAPTAPDASSGLMWRFNLVHPDGFHVVHVFGKYGDLASPKRNPRWLGPEGQVYGAAPKGGSKDLGGLYVYDLNSFRYRILYNFTDPSGEITSFFPLHFLTIF